MADTDPAGAERTVVEVTLTEQQAVVLDNLRRTGELGAADGEIIRRVFREFLRQDGPEPHPTSPASSPPRIGGSGGPYPGSGGPQYGALHTDLLLEPVTGKALPVRRGEVLRLVQVEGEQCVDLNAFNLHDYKECMSISSTRSANGFRIARGDLIWTIHSRDRPMYLVLELSEHCVTDLLGGRCRAASFARRGYGLHTNCQDTLAAAVGEYGLTPDDVHDALNLWYNTEWDAEGHGRTNWNTAPPGDYVDLLAIMDTLAVPAICGSGDVRITSNFWLKSVRVQVFAASPDTLALAADVEREHSGFVGQRTPADFAVCAIKPDRALAPTPGYVPQFVNYPLRTRTVSVELTRAELAQAETLVARGFARSVPEALRLALLLWYTKHREPRTGKLRG